MSNSRKDVLTVVERNGKSFWTKVGSAFENRDGSLSVLLDALPVNGKLQIREPRQRDETRSTGQASGGNGQPEEDWPI